MSEYTRRSFLSDLSTLSTGIIGSSLLGCKHNETPTEPKPRIALPGNQGDLCLIFPGAWLFSFDGSNGINALTPHNSAHLYECAVSPVSTAYSPINAGKYQVSVSRPAGLPKKTPKDLVSAMAKNGNGFVFNKAVTLADLSGKKNLRTIYIPMPDAINEVALTLDNAVDTAVDPNSVLTTLSGAGQIVRLPSAYIFRYTALTWTTAAVVDSQSNVVLGPLGTSGVAANHFVFRVRPDPKVMPPCSLTDRPCFARDAGHANMTFKALMSLLNFNNLTEPVIQVPFSGNSLLATVPPLPDVDPSEYGGVPTKGVQLANCGASGGLEGGDDPPS